MSPRQREVQSDGGVRRHDPLDGGVGDVPLVPQRHVLQRRGDRRADQPRKPVKFSDRTGLRLCGIADEPFWPGEKYSSASRTSVR